jgi:hypothetical protein
MLAGRRCRAVDKPPRAADRAGDDRGTTLIDVVVSTTIMSFCMAMFTTGILQIYRFTNKNETISTTQQQINIAFMRLDKEIRYAVNISAPGQVGSDAYVEYLTANTASPVCTELRLLVSTRQLQRRTWVQGSSPVAPSAWLPLASNVTSTQPFTVTAADATFAFQRLELKLTATDGTGGTVSSTQTDVTFTALNSSLETSNAGICVEGRSIP